MAHNYLLIRKGPSEGKLIVGYSNRLVGNSPGYRHEPVFHVWDEYDNFLGKLTIEPEVLGLVGGGWGNTLGFIGYLASIKLEGDDETENDDELKTNPDLARFSQERLNANGFFEHSRARVRGWYSPESRTGWIEITEGWEFPGYPGPRRNNSDEELVKRYKEAMHQPKTRTGQPK